MRNIKMEVNKKEGGEFKKVGDVTLFYPLLSELGIAIEPKEDDEAGFPVYEDEKVQYVFDAVLSAVKANARNKLVSGSVELKPNNKIAETVEELLAAADRSGEALKIRREFLDAFKKYLPSTGKSAAYQAAIYDLVSTPKVIPLQTADRKAKIVAMITSFADSLETAAAERFAKYLLAINESCSAIDALDAE